jgi:hypothetical protein
MKSLQQRAGASVAQTGAVKGNRSCSPNPPPAGFSVEAFITPG